MELKAEAVLTIVVHPGGGDLCFLLHGAMIDCDRLHAVVDVPNEVRSKVVKVMVEKFIPL